MKRRVLYVEDDPVNALMIVKLLKNDFEIFHVPDGESALQHLDKGKIDLILMDINLGKDKIDGIQTLKSIRTMPRFLRIPIIAFTSYGLPEDEKRFLAEGFDDYLTKPVEKRVLTERINKFFN
jgi:two-component system, cell cycle response regulator DivK